jgi:hypothetical protein
MRARSGLSQLRVAIRWSGALFGVAALGVGVGLLLGQPWAIGLWPFGALESPLGLVFLASIAMAVAAPTIWIGLSGEVRAAQAGALNLLITFGGWSGYLLSEGQRQGRIDWVATGAACAVAALTMALMAILSGRTAWSDERWVSKWLRGSFAVFAALLIVVGGLLVAAAPTVFPWPAAPSSSVMYGWIFLGAAAYFIHAALQPRRANSTGQLLGFLAYDLVLIGPFIAHFSTVRSEHRLSLMIFTAVLVYSGVLAIYHLFIHADSRLRSGRPGAREPIGTN